MRGREREEVHRTFFPPSMHVLTHVDVLFRSTTIKFIPFLGGDVTVRSMGCRGAMEVGE